MPFEITSKPDRGNRLIAERHGRAAPRGVAEIAPDFQPPDAGS